VPDDKQAIYKEGSHECMHITTTTTAAAAAPIMTTITTTTAATTTTTQPLRDNNYHWDYYYYYYYYYYYNTCVLHSWTSPIRTAISEMGVLTKKNLLASSMMGVTVRLSISVVIVVVVVVVGHDDVIMTGGGERGRMERKKGRRWEGI